MLRVRYVGLGIAAHSVGIAETDSILPETNRRRRRIRRSSDHWNVPVVSRQISTFNRPVPRVLIVVNHKKDVLRITVVGIASKSGAKDARRSVILVVCWHVHDGYRVRAGPHSRPMRFSRHVIAQPERHQRRKSQCEEIFAFIRQPIAVGVLTDSASLGCSIGARKIVSRSIRCRIGIQAPLDAHRGRSTTLHA